MVYFGKGLLNVTVAVVDMCDAHQAARRPTALKERKRDGLRREYCRANVTPPYAPYSTTSKFPTTNRPACRVICDVGHTMK